VISGHGSQTYENLLNINGNLRFECKANMNENLWFGGLAPKPMKNILNINTNWRSQGMALKHVIRNHNGWLAWCFKYNQHSPVEIANRCKWENCVKPRPYSYRVAPWDQGFAWHRCVIVADSGAAVEYYLLELVGGWYAFGKFRASSKYTEIDNLVKKIFLRIESAWWGKILVNLPGVFCTRSEPAPPI